MPEEMLDIVDDDDNVVGVASRTHIHDYHLPHREVAILFITPDGDIIFQRRSMMKATNPGLLAFAVAGHVTAGDTYEGAVLKEAFEETGLQLDLEHLVLLQKDRSTNPANPCHRKTFAYIFTGQLDDLVPEPGEGDGFVAIKGADIFNLPDHLKPEFATNLLNPDTYGPIYQKALALVV